MDCRHCGKEFSDDWDRYVFLARFVQSRRERACFDFACIDCGKIGAMKERRARLARFKLDDETESVGPFRHGTKGGERIIKSGKEMS